MKASLFASSPGSGPKMSWEKPMSYPAIKGLTRLINITMAHFGAACDSGAYNYVWMTSPNYGDIFHPMETSEITLHNVLERSKVCLKDTKGLVDSTKISLLNNVFTGWVMWILSV